MSNGAGGRLKRAKSENSLLDILLLTVHVKC